MDLSIFMSCWRALFFLCCSVAWSGQAARCISACTCLDLMLCPRYCAQIYSWGKKNNHLLPSFLFPLLNVSNCSMVLWKPIGLPRTRGKKMVSRVLNNSSQVSFSSGFCISDYFWQGFFQCFAMGKSYWGYKEAGLGKSGVTTVV